MSLPTRMSTMWYRQSYLDSLDDKGRSEIKFSIPIEYGDVVDFSTVPTYQENTVGFTAAVESPPPMHETYVLYFGEEGFEIITRLKQYRFKGSKYKSPSRSVYACVPILRSRVGQVTNTYLLSQHVAEDDGKSRD